jgi:hypothetical protein
MARRDDMAKLRGLLGEKGYAAEALPGRGRMKLVRLDIGHAVKRSDGRTAFTVAEAIQYLRGVADDEDA